MQAERVEGALNSSSTRAETGADKEYRIREIALQVAAARGKSEYGLLTLPLAGKDTLVAVPPLQLPYIPIDIEDEDSLHEQERLQRCAWRIVTSLLPHHIMCFTAAKGEPFKHYIPFSLFQCVEDIRPNSGKVVRTVSRAQAHADFLEFHARVSAGADPKAEGAGRLATLFVEVPLPALPSVIPLDEDFLICNAWLPARTELPKSAKPGRYDVAHIINVPHVRTRLLCKICRTGDTFASGKPVFAGKLRIEIKKSKELTDEVEEAAPAPVFSQPSMTECIHRCQQFIGGMSSVAIAALLWTELHSRTEAVPMTCTSRLNTLAFLSHNLNYSVFRNIIDSETSTPNLRDIFIPFYSSRPHKPRNVRSWNSTMDAVASTVRGHVTNGTVSTQRFTPLCRLLALCCMWSACVEASPSALILDAMPDKCGNPLLDTLRAILTLAGYSSAELAKLFTVAKEVGRKCVRLLDQSNEFGREGDLSDSPAEYYACIMRCAAFSAPAVATVLETACEARCGMEDVASWAVFAKACVPTIEGESGGFPEYLLPFLRTISSTPSDSQLGMPATDVPAEANGATVVKPSAPWACGFCGRSYNTWITRCIHHNPYVDFPRNAKLLKECSVDNLLILAAVNEAYFHEVTSRDESLSLIEQELHARGVSVALSWKSLRIVGGRVFSAQAEHTAETNAHDISAEDAIAELLAEDDAEYQRKKRQAGVVKRGTVKPSVPCTDRSSPLTADSGGPSCHSSASSSVSPIADPVLPAADPVLPTTLGDDTEDTTPFTTISRSGAQKAKPRFTTADRPGAFQTTATKMDVDKRIPLMKAGGAALPLRAQISRSLTAARNNRPSPAESTGHINVSVGPGVTISKTHISQACSGTSAAASASISAHVEVPFVAELGKDLFLGALDFSAQDDESNGPRSPILPMLSSMQPLITTATTPHVGQKPLTHEETMTGSMLDSLFDTDVVSERFDETNLAIPQVLRPTSFSEATSQQLLAVVNDLTHMLSCALFEKAKAEDTIATLRRQLASSQSSMEARLQHAHDELQHCKVEHTIEVSSLRSQLLQEKASHLMERAAWSSGGWQSGSGPINFSAAGAPSGTMAEAIPSGLASNLGFGPSADIATMLLAEQGSNSYPTLAELSSGLRNQPQIPPAPFKLS